MMLPNRVEGICGAGGAGLGVEGEAEGSDRLAGTSVQVLLETDKNIPYVGNTAKRCNCIAEGLVFQSQQVGQLFLIQFLDPLCNVVVQNERKELLLLVGVPFKYAPSVTINTLCTG